MLLSWTMSVYLWSAFLADEQQSCWTHALVCLFKSRRLQSYWLVLCSDHSNNQADSHQKALEWASFTTENIWTTLCPLCRVRPVWFAQRQQCKHLAFKSCLTLRVIRLPSWNHLHRAANQNKDTLAVCHLDKRWHAHFGSQWCCVIRRVERQSRKETLSQTQEANMCSLHGSHEPKSFVWFWRHALSDRQFLILFCKHGL